MPTNEQSSAESHPSRVNRRLAVASWILLVVLVVSVSLSSDLRGQVAVGLMAAVLALLAWAALWRPSLSVDDNGITIVNVFRTIRVPWEAVVHVDTKFALTIFTPGKRFAVWSAPQPGALAVTRAHRRNRKDASATSALDAGVRVGDLRGTESGDAAALVRERWQAFLARAGDFDSDAATVDLRIHVGVLAALAVGIVLVTFVPQLL